ncbi:hypothetical protein FRC00_011121 [Tulasnella sp. 408]|nr:hypothetical protein FRC00_011121 [Tulasnella sp. 408]
MDENVPDSENATRIAKFLGFHANFERSEAWLLSPWEPNGNVSEFIKAHDLEVSEKLSLVYDTIDALAFLHQRNPPVCHGDVKPANVLITAEYNARLCDFGLARLHEDSEFSKLDTSTGHKGTIRWCSPELFRGNPRSPVSDVYAWAWLVWEIMTGELPHQQASHDPDVMREILENPLPRLDGELRFSQCPELWDLMTRCWSFDPPLRPTAENCKFIVSYYPRSTIYVHVPANRNSQKLKNIDEISEPEPDLPSAFFPSHPDSTRSLRRVPLPGAAEVPIGAIVEIQAGKGIVKYNGITKFAPGRWIGVELSEPQGKNDGSVDGESLPMSTMSTPYTLRPLEALVSGIMLLKSTMSANSIAAGPAGLRNRAISAHDIVLEGSNPIDVTGHFADLFVGMYRNKVRVALKRLRIPRHPSERHKRDIEV